MNKLGSRTSWREIARMVATLAVASVLHFDVLNGPYCLTSDEAFSWIVASKGDPNLIVGITARDVHPPAYYLLLSGWSRLFGTGESALRSLSGVLSLATILAVYWYARVWSG